MSLILKVAEAKIAADEATWADAKGVLKDAARRYRVDYADRGAMVIVTNKESGDSAILKFSGGKVDAKMYEEGDRSPYGSDTILLSSFRTPGDWKERLEMVVEAVSL